MANNTRKKGFSFLSFLLGILFGMILLVAGVAGALFFALKTDVDTALNMVGLENKDEEGNSVYINSDVETGGAASLLDLVSKVSVLASSGAELSVSDVEGLLPVVGGYVDGLYEMINSFIPMEREELTTVKFSGLSEFVQAKLFDVQPAVLFENFGMTGLVDSKLMSIIFLGPEADYIQVGEDRYPLYYDKFYNEGAFTREDDAAILPESLTGDAEEVDGAYRVYYYFDGETAYTKNSGAEYTLYTPEYATLTGYYYRNGEERVVVTPVSVRDFADGQFSMLDSVYLSDLLADGNELADELLGGISLGDLMNNGVDFNEILQKLSITAFIDIKAEEAVMAYLGYGLYGVTNTDEGVYTANYDVNGTEVTAYIETDESGVITNCYYLDGETQVKINGTGIDGISGRITNVTKKLTIGDFVGETDDPIISKLGKYTIDSVTDGIQTLTISDVMGDIDESNLILYNIKDATIGELPETVANLTINSIYADEIYKNGDEKGSISLATVYVSDYLYYTLENGKYKLVDEGHGLGKLELTEFKLNTYYTYGATDGVWKMLLYAKTEAGGKTEMAYTVNNLGSMIDNVAENMSKSTLLELHNAGILQFTNVENLNNKIPYYVGGQLQYSKPIGEMGLMDFINLVVNNISRATGN